jgi:hypothetical protein
MANLLFDATHQTTRKAKIFSCTTLYSVQDPLSCNLSRQLIVLPGDAQQIKDFSALDLFSFCGIFLLKYSPRMERVRGSQWLLEGVLMPE